MRPIDSKYSKYRIAIHQSQGFLYPFCIDDLYHFRMDMKNIIAKWIKTTRTKAGLSQTALGAKLTFELREEEYSKARISHWENSRHMPTIFELAAIRKITNSYLPIEISGIEPLDEGGANQPRDRRAGDKIH